MRIALVATARDQRVALIHADGRHEDAGTDFFNPAPSGAEIQAPIPLATGPLPRPAKIVAIGLNYRDHAAEAGQPVPDTPLVFAKFPSSIIGSGHPITLPGASRQVDYEAELAVLIGHRAARVSPSRALEHVFGYTCLNDVSARDVQASDGQWVRAKSFDTFCPVGPVVVTADEIADPQDLPISCEVNGATVQDSNTSQMVFGVAELISFISQDITLEPGDLIATGTPPGVGLSRDPQLFLGDGDRVVVEIGGIGRLVNPVQG